MRHFHAYLFGLDISNDISNENNNKITIIRCSRRRHTSSPVLPPGELHETYVSSLILVYSLRYVQTWPRLEDLERKPKQLKPLRLDNLLWFRIHHCAGTSGFLQLRLEVIIIYNNDAIHKIGNVVLPSEEDPATPATGSVHRKFHEICVIFQYMRADGQTHKLTDTDRHMGTLIANSQYFMNLPGPKL